VGVGMSGRRRLRAALRSPATQNAPVRRNVTRSIMVRRRGCGSARFEICAGGWFSRSRIRWCNRLALPRLRAHLPIRIPLKKIHMAPCRISIRLPFPTTPGIVPRRPPRAMPPLTTNRAPERKRHEKTLLTLLTLCEAPSFVARTSTWKTARETLLTLLTLREAHSFCGSVRRPRDAPGSRPRLAPRTRRSAAARAPHPIDGLLRLTPGPHRGYPLKGATALAVALL
jgi:hypothetical protein